MLFDCPITSAAVPVWRVAVHAGLAVFAVVAGSGFVGRAALVYARRAGR